MFTHLIIGISVSASFIPPAVFLWSCELLRPVHWVRSCKFRKNPTRARAHLRSCRLLNHGIVITRRVLLDRCETVGIPASNHPSVWAQTEHIFPSCQIRASGEGVFLRERDYFDFERSCVWIYTVTSRNPWQVLAIDYLSRNELSWSPPRDMRQAMVESSPNYSLKHQFPHDLQSILANCIPIAFTIPASLWPQISGAAFQKLGWNPAKIV